MANKISPRHDGRTDVGIAEEVIGKALLLKKGTAQDGLLLCDAGERAIGASINSAAAVGDQVEYSEAGASNWVELTTSEAIGAGAEFTAAANGQIAALATSGGGTEDVIGILHPRQAAATDADQKVIGRLYERPFQRVIPGGTEGNVAAFDDAGQPVDDSGFAAGDAETLHGLAVTAPVAGDDGKVLSYDHGTTSYVWVANS